ncbi:MAG TPA: DUF6345 domain-containing protein [Candidatus Limnocylindrales bacterium]|nr:DUF6345 domain-containing protein [Candidatus Limnocylindrales bacterium]
MTILHQCVPRTAWHVLLAIASVFASASPALANHLEAKMYGVDNWDLDCSGNSLNWSAQVDRWYNEMDDHGWYTRDGRFVDTGMDRSPFCDPDSGASPCVDHNRMDDGDAVMVFYHGGDSGNHWRALVRSDGGAAVNDCYIDSPESSTEGGNGAELFAGDMDMEFLHLSSCQSLDDDNLNHAWRMMRDPIDSPASGQRLHQVGGFHGCMWIGSSWRDDYEDFADDAFSTSIKNAWLDNHYRNNVGEDDEEQCPVAMAIGTSEADCFNRIDNERYNNIFGDPAGNNYYCYYFFDGCNPACEDAFNDPND